MRALCVSITFIEHSFHENPSNPQCPQNPQCSNRSALHCIIMQCSPIMRYFSPFPVTPPTVQGAENPDGSGVEFTCTVNGTGNVTLEWSSTTLVSLVNLTGESTILDGTVTSTLTITNVTDAGGDYTCTASYESGSSSSTVTLRTVIESTMNIGVVAGDTEVLVCVSDTLHVWILCTTAGSGDIDLAPGGSGMGAGLLTEGITNGSTLVFSPVEFGDEGCYQCVPQLQGGSDTFNEVQLTGTLDRVYITLRVC